MEVCSSGVSIPFLLFRCDNFLPMWRGFTTLQYPLSAGSPSCPVGETFALPVKEVHI